VLASILTAVAVNIAGSIGFIGLIVPHLVRLAMRSTAGNDQRLLLPASVLAGSTLLVAADTLARKSRRAAAVAGRRAHGPARRAGLSLPSVAPAERDWRMMPEPTPLLNVHGLDVAIAGKTLVRGLDINLMGGDTLAILGRNGSGKTTLLHTLAGLRPPTQGDIDLCGKPYAAHGPRAAARLRGLLAQAQTDAFPASVLETALIGRHPHLGRWAWEGAQDERHRPRRAGGGRPPGPGEREVHSLSGGERQRLGIATLLTQQPLLYLLDETARPSRSRPPDRDAGPHAALRH